MPTATTQARRRGRRVEYVRIRVEDMLSLTKVPWRLLPTDVIEQVKREADEAGDTVLSKKAYVALYNRQSEG